MPTTTLKNIRRQFLREVPSAGAYYPTASDSYSAVVAGSVTNARWADSNLASESFKGQLLFRPDAVNATDLIRHAGALTVASGLLAHTGANYTDTTITSETLEKWIQEHLYPDGEWLRCANDALEYEFAEHVVPLSNADFSDFDMASSATTSFTASGAEATLTKATTANTLVYSGIRSLSIALTAAGNATTATAVRATGGAPYQAWTLFRAAAGSGGIVSFSVRDAGGELAVVNTTANQDANRWQYAWINGSLDADTNIVNLRLASTGATDTLYWDCLSFLQTTDNWIYLPSTVTERFKLLGLSRSDFQFPTTSGMADAQSRTLTRLEEGRDFIFHAHQAEANPYAIEILRSGLLSYPLWLHIRRPYSDIDSLSAETDTTTCPPHTLLPRIKYLWGERYAKEFPGLKAQAFKEIQERAPGRRTAQPQRERWGGVPLGL